MADPKEPGRFKDACGIIMRVLLLCIAISSFILSLATTGGCDFFIFNPAEPPLNITLELPEGIREIKYATVGLYRYDPDGLGCRSISDDFDDIGWQLTTARVGNSLAIIFSAVAMVLMIVDFFCCRFVCSRVILSCCYIVAFIAQALTFLVFAADVCKPPFNNAPNSCDTDTASYISISATCLFFIASFLVCAVAKPLPVFVRVKKSIQSRDKTDPCWPWCRRKPKEEQEDIEKGKGEDEEATGEEEEEEEEEVVVEMTEEEMSKLLREQQAQAVVVTALATARLGKQEEIEKQLEMLTRYKDYIPEEEYEEKVAKLLLALPDPETYDMATKTDALVPAQEEEEKVEEERESNDEIDVDAVDMEEEEAEEDKKSAIGYAVTSSGEVIASGFSSVKKSVTPGSKKAPEAPADVPQAAPQAPPEMS